MAFGLVVGIGEAVTDIAGNLVYLLLVLGVCKTYGFGCRVARTRMSGCVGCTIASFRESGVVDVVQVGHYGSVLIAAELIDVGALGITVIVAHR